MPPEDRDTVARALAAFVAALNDLDPVRLTACFLEDAPIFMPWGGHRQTHFWADRFDIWREERTGPPYLNTQPVDLRIQQIGETAIATFHLEHDPKTLGRRTIVLAQTPDGWKIAHLHASTLPRKASE